MRTFLLAVSTLLLIGCGADNSNAAGPLLRHRGQPDAREGSDALIVGVLDFDNGCLYVSIDEIGERFPVLWPAQTSWDAERSTVIVPSGAEIAVGAEAYGSGGYHYVDDIEQLAGPDVADRAERCVDNTYGEIAVVNNLPDAIGPG